MGRFSTTVHIKNNADRMRFVNTFCDIMKKRGFVPCAEDEAAQSYLFAFGEGWATIANEGYRDDPKKAYDDTREMAAALNTSAFSVEVVDSDFAVLTLNNGDSVIVGDGSGYGIEEPTRGNRKYWEPLLAAGKTWERFSEICRSEETFVEDTLCDVAEALGIDPYYICADFDQVSERADGGSEVVAFYFKKAAGKAMSLNAAFVKVFGEALEPLGFKKIKYKYPCFVRNVGNEIFQIITYVKRKGTPAINGYVREDCKQYDIVCKVETVYSKEIELPTKNFEKYSGYLSKWDIYVKEHVADFDNDYMKKVGKYFPYKSGDEQLTISGLEDAVDLTKQLLLPALDNVNDFKSYLDFYFKFKGEPFLEYEPGNYDYLNQYDGLVRIKIDTWDSFLECNEGYKLRGYDLSDERDKRALANNPNNAERISLFHERTEKKRQEYLSKHEEREALAKQMFGDKEWCEKALEELERRKAANTELLRSYGLDI